MATINFNSCFKTNSDLYLKSFTNAKHRWHRNISVILKKLIPWIPLLIYGLFVGTLICFSITHKDKVIIVLEKFIHKIQTMGIGGVIMLYCIIFLTTFPLVFGYSTLITLSGFIYGFSFGFLISYVAALTGAVTVFCLSRKWFKKPVRKWLNRNKSMSAVVRAVEKKGFNLLFLIRIAPYPYNILNMLLSATHLSLSTFTAATALSLFKLMIHVWIGSKMSSFSAFTSHVGIISSEIDNSIKPSLSKNNHFTKSFNFIVMLCSIAIGICIIIYVWILARKAIKEVEDENGGEYIWLDGYEINEINEVGDNVILLGNGEMRFRRNSVVFCDDVESDSNINLKPHFNEKDSIQMQSIVSS